MKHPEIERHGILRTGVARTRSLQLCHSLRHYLDCISSREAGWQ